MAGQCLRAELSAMDLTGWRGVAVLAPETNVSVRHEGLRIELRVEAPQPTTLAQECSAVAAYALQRLAQDTASRTNAIHARRLAAVDRQLQTLAGDPMEGAKAARDELWRHRAKLLLDSATGHWSTHLVVGAPQPTRSRPPSPAFGARPPVWFVVVAGPLLGLLLVALVALTATGPTIGRRSEP